MVNSFGIEVANDEKSSISVSNVLNAALPAVSHPNQDVKNAATKIILDVQRLSGRVTDTTLT